MVQQRGKSTKGHIIQQYYCSYSDRIKQQKQSIAKNNIKQLIRYSFYSFNKFQPFLKKLIFTVFIGNFLGFAEYIQDIENWCVIISVKFVKFNNKSINNL